ncbi:hypothetical protein EIP86_001698 [Pleurotus ostreatoroseus]|nr:hypothetical protein EIP86_001698 [Pleurotus ostreatoroseus]
MASTTNAGKIWQLLHQNDDFASTILLGVSKDDTDKVQSALDIVNIDPSDLNLTDEEIENFFRGVTASGALELTSWEGYYVTEPLPGSGDKYALLILSLDNTVYWGPESELIQDFKSFAIPYQLSEDGTLRFSTAAGDVVLTFSRVYDMEKGTVEVGTFKGTSGGIAVAGSQAQSLPPWSNGTRSNKVTKRSDKKVSVSLIAPDDSDPDSSPVPWYSTDVGGNFMAVLGILGSVVAGIQIYLWIRQLYQSKSRQQVSEELTEVLTHEQSLALAVASAKVNIPDIDWSSSRTGFTNAVEQELNERLREMGVDFASTDAESIVQSLRETIRDALRAEFESHAVRTVTKNVLDQSDAFKALPDHFQWATDLARTIGMDRAGEMFGSLGYDSDPSVFDSLGRSVVNKARSVFFYENADAADAAASQANKEASDAAARREAIEKAIEDLDKEIEQDKESGNEDRLLEDQHRREQLENQLERERKAEEEKEKEAEERQHEADTSREQAGESKDEADRSHNEWDGFMEEHGL